MLPLLGPADLTSENVRMFDDALKSGTRPILVHRASGNRVGALATRRGACIEGRAA
jgi:protein tyrosine phosphatase (PTP) superfamily phosphohydrolase (DUF442 family)